MIWFLIALTGCTAFLSRTSAGKRMCRTDTGMPDSVWLSAQPHGTTAQWPVLKGGTRGTKTCLQSLHQSTVIGSRPSHDLLITNPNSYAILRQTTDKRRVQTLTAWLSLQSFLADWSSEARRPTWALLAWLPGRSWLAETSLASRISAISYAAWPTRVAR